MRNYGEGKSTRERERSLAKKGIKGGIMNFHRHQSWTSKKKGRKKMEKADAEGKRDNLIVLW